MGAPPDARKRFPTLSLYWVEPAEPQHESRVQPFEIGKYKVTADEYAQFLNDSRQSGIDVSTFVYTGNNSTLRLTYSGYAAVPGFEYAPATQVPYRGARQYCEWLSAKTKRKCRLPSEIEWEFAAKGSSERTYPWGEESPIGRCYLAQHYKRGFRYPAACNVGSFPSGATPEGVHDLLGNGGEWCGNYLYKYTDSRIIDPNFDSPSFLSPPLPANDIAGGPATVQRGGGYINQGNTATAWTRFPGGSPLAYGPYGLSFRIVREIE